MGGSATLTTVERDPDVLAVARRRLGGDGRAEFVAADAHAFLDAHTEPAFDLAFVDCRPGKFERLVDVVRLLKPGALYIGDDLTPHAGWPDGHRKHVDAFLRELPAVSELVATPMRWSSGLVVAARR